MRFLALATTTLAALVAGSVAYGSAGTAGPCASGTTTASTASYKMALDIGKQENMYLPSEVNARHLKTGEIMLGGEMAMVSPTAGTRVYHLEVHICNKTTDAVVEKLKPAIVVEDSSGSMMSSTLPAAIMVGIGAPMSDYHYGNDIVL
jgi:hypothetical protein